MKPSPKKVAKRSLANGFSIHTNHANSHAQHLDVVGIRRLPLGVDRLKADVSLRNQNVPCDTEKTLCSIDESVANERLTGAALDRLTHRCHILETKGESYRLAEAKKRRRSSTT